MKVEILPEAQRMLWQEFVTLPKHFVLYGGTAVLQEEENSWSATVERGAPVKISFFGGIDFGRVGEPEHADNGVAVASVLDLAGTKLKVLLQRIEIKDYLDVVALLKSGSELGDLLGAARALLGPAFNPLLAQKTLIYFAPPELAALPESAKQILQNAAGHDVRIPEMKKIAERVD